MNYGRDQQNLLGLVEMLKTTVKNLDALELTDQETETQRDQLQLELNDLKSNDDLVKMTKHLTKLQAEIKLFQGITRCRVNPEDHNVLYIVDQYEGELKMVEVTAEKEEFEKVRKVWEEL